MIKYTLLKNDANLIKMLQNLVVVILLCCLVQIVDVLALMVKS